VSGVSRAAGPGAGHPAVRPPAVLQVQHQPRGPAVTRPAGEPECCLSLTSQTSYVVRRYFKCHGLTSQGLPPTCRSWMLCSCWVFSSLALTSGVLSPQMHRRVTCPTCRARTAVTDLAYVDGGSKAPSTAAHDDAGDGEAAIEVKGSYSTKARSEWLPPAST